MLLRAYRFPVKSAGGEELDRVAVTPGGLDGDRAWAAVTAEGVVVSAKHPRRWGRLLACSARLAGPGADGEVLVTVPGHGPAPAGSDRLDAALGAWLDAPVRLTRTVPERAVLHRLWPTEPGMLADWVDAAPGSEAVTAVAGARPGGRFVDFGAVHLVTAAALDALRALGPDADPRRFRPNLVLDLPREPEPGDVLLVGDGVRLRVLTPTPRCAVPALAQQGLPADPAVLRTLGRAYRRAVPGRGAAACFGCYAEVLAPGTVTVGGPAGYA